MVIDDDTEGYVAYYDVQDEDDDALHRLFAVLTTKKINGDISSRWCYSSIYVARILLEYQYF